MPYNALMTWVPSDRRHLGRRLLACEVVTSTNDVAADLASGEAVYALTQTSGRGQHGRTWVSPPGDNLLLSIRLDPPPELRRPVLLTALVAVAVGDAVQRLAGVTPVVKWPNDLLLGDRKLCGILIEQGRATVAGVGLNLKSPGLPTATSLAECGADVSPAQAADAVLTALDARYSELLIDPAPLEAAWRDRLFLVGRVVVAEFPDGSTTVGRLLAVGFDRVEVQTREGPVSVAPERLRHLWPV